MILILNLVALALGGKFTYIYNWLLAQIQTAACLINP